MIHTLFGPLSVIMLFVLPHDSHAVTVRSAWSCS